MAEPGKEEDHMELTSSWPHDTIQVVVVSPASIGAAEGEGSDESAAGTAIDSEAAAARSKLTPFGPSVSQKREINDAVDHAGANQEINTSGSEAEENAAPLSEEVFAKVTKKLSNAVPKRYDMTPSIYKVPNELKGGVGDHKDYRPVVVYLGFCLRTGHDRRECKLEEYKWCCVRRLIDQLHGHAVDTVKDREDNVKDREVLRSCMESMKRLLPKVLASYSQHIKVINNDEMAVQMLLDGCLILVLLLMHAPSGAAESRNNHVGWIYNVGHQAMWESMIRDMLLLENQIPFCVVKELFELLKIECESEELLFTGSCELFSSPSLETHNLVSVVERNEVKHLLHLYYLSIGFPHEERPNKPDHDLTQWIPSAKELEEAGIRFRKRRNPTSFLDISFDYRKGVLEIPRLELYDSSGVLFRNLIAFEQTYPETLCDVSAYMGFMDYLVNTPEDMRILHLRGILVNDMNCEQDASRFFSQLCVAVCIPLDNYLAGVMQEVSKYKDSRRHKWRAALVRNYFSNPWMTMSVLAAMLLLILTFLQTLFAIYPYYRPSRRG